jgi:hypothetical protein
LINGDQECSQIKQFSLTARYLWIQKSIKIKPYNLENAPKFLSKEQVEYILLEELKRSEPYLEEEKDQLYLSFLPCDPSLLRTENGIDDLVNPNA